MVTSNVTEPTLVAVCRTFVKKRYPSAIISALYNGRYKKAMKEKVLEDLQHLCTEMCTDSFMSTLKGTKPSSLLVFDWELLNLEFKEKAPLFHDVLHTIVGSSKQNRR